MTDTDTESDFDQRLRRARQAFDPTSDTPDAMPGQGDNTTRGILMAAMEFSVTLIAGAVLGWFIDRHFGSSPFGVIILTILGMVAGVYNLYRSIKGYGEQLGYGGKSRFDQKDSD
jgi:ATP synthase protein I